MVVEIPYCESNEKRSKTFIKKFNYFTNNLFNIRIKWKTRKIKSLFLLKDKIQHPACKIYEGTCNVCNIKYIGETKRNTEIRFSEHNNPNGKSEPSIHLTRNISHSFDWKILCAALSNDRTRKNLEAFYIKINRPQLNEQVQSNVLTLFHNGIT